MYYTFIIICFLVWFFKIERIEILALLGFYFCFLIAYSRFFIASKISLFFSKEEIQTLFLEGIFIIFLLFLLLWFLLVVFSWNDVNRFLARFLSFREFYNSEIFYALHNLARKKVPLYFRFTIFLKSSFPQSKIKQNILFSCFVVFPFFLIIISFSLDLWFFKNVVLLNYLPFYLSLFLLFRIYTFIIELVIESNYKTIKPALEALYLRFGGQIPHLAFFLICEEKDVLPHLRTQLKHLQETPGTSFYGTSFPPEEWYQTFKEVCVCAKSFVLFTQRSDEWRGKLLKGAFGIILLNVILFYI